MQPIRQQPLPAELRRRAEHFFGSDMSGVRLSVSPEPALYGAKAFARGSEIHLLPSYSDFSRKENLAVLGHELTHVLQQRRGQLPTAVRPRQHFWDAALEQQADLLGNRFAEGVSPGQVFPPAAATALDTRATQCTVMLGMRELKKLDQMTETARLILSLIEGGITWLHWAMTDSEVLYKFADENQLIEVVQMGPHGTPMLLIKPLKVLVNPLKLTTYSVSDLKKLVRLGQGQFEEGEEENLASLLWEEFGLINQDALNDTILMNLPTVWGAPVFQAPDLQARMAIWHADNPPDNSMSFREEAAEFAVLAAQSPFEFADYYQYYINLVSRGGKRRGTKSQRFEWAGDIANALSPILDNSLRSPVLPTIPDPANLRQDLRQWYSQGFTLGFARKSHGYAQLATNTNLGSKRCINLYGLAKTYQEEARDFLLTYEADQIELSQDGQSRTYTYNEGNQSAVLTLDGLGGLTLTSFQPLQNTHEDDGQETTQNERATTA